MLLSYGLVAGIVLGRAIGVRRGLPVATALRHRLSLAPGGFAGHARGASRIVGPSAASVDAMAALSAGGVARRCRLTIGIAAWNSAKHTRNANGMAAQVLELRGNPEARAGNAPGS